MFSNEKTCRRTYSKHEHNSKWIKFLELLQSDKSRSTKSWSNNSLILVVSLVGNSLIVLIIYKTPTLRKSINMLIANMAMSDLLFPIFLIPVRLTELHFGLWLIGGTLGQALCKIQAFFASISMLVSIQSLVLITVDRYGAVVVPLRSPLISRKVCRCLIVGTRILAAAVFSPYLFTFNLVEYQEKKWCVSR